MSELNKEQLEHAHKLLTSYPNAPVPNPKTQEVSTLSEAVKLCPTPEHGTNPVIAMLAAMTMDQARAVWGEPEAT